VSLWGRRRGGKDAHNQVALSKLSLEDLVNRDRRTLQLVYFMFRLAGSGMRGDEDVVDESDGGGIHCPAKKRRVSADGRSRKESTLRCAVHVHQVSAKLEPDRLRQKVFRQKSRKEGDGGEGERGQLRERRSRKGNRKESSARRSRKTHHEPLTKPFRNLHQLIDAVQVLASVDSKGVSVLPIQLRHQVLSKDV
jgi:hypothetical protein